MVSRRQQGMSVRLKAITLRRGHSLRGLGFNVAFCTNVRLPFTSRRQGLHHARSYRVAIHSSLTATLSVLPLIGRLYLHGPIVHASYPSFTAGCYCGPNKLFFSMLAHMIRWHGLERCHDMGRRT